MTNDIARKSTVTIADFVATHSRIIWGNGPHEKRSLAKMARFCAFSGYGNQRLDSFRSEHLYEFMSHIETDQTPRKPNGCSPATTNRYVACLSSVFRHAEEMGLIQQAPRVKFRKISKHEQHKRRFLSDRELDANCSSIWAAWHNNTNGSENLWSLVLTQVCASVKYEA